jgi:hypothetical protein
MAAMKQQLEDLKRRLEEDEAAKRRALAEKEASLQAEWEALEKAKRAAADLEEIQVGQSASLSAHARPPPPSPSASAGSSNQHRLRLCDFYLPITPASPSHPPL